MTENTDPNDDGQPTTELRCPLCKEPLDDSPPDPELYECPEHGEIRAGPVPMDDYPDLTTESKKPPQTDDTPKEMEETIREKVGLPSFEDALRAVAEGAPPPSEKRQSVVASRRSFRVRTDEGWQRFPAKAFLKGPVEFADSLPLPEQKFQRKSDNGRPPMAGPTPEQQFPIIRGDVFGRDRTVAIIAYMIIRPRDHREE